jgi:hypothetical protein
MPMTVIAATDFTARREVDSPGALSGAMSPLRHEPDTGYHAHKDVIRIALRPRMLNELTGHQRCLHAPHGSFPRHFSRQVSPSVLVPTSDMPPDFARLRMLDFRVSLAHMLRCFHRRQQPA